MQALVVVCVQQIKMNNGSNKPWRVSTSSLSTRTFVLTKAKCILSGRLRILVRGSALSTLKSGVNVCLDDNSHILRLDGGQKKAALFLVLGNVFHRLLITANIITLSPVALRINFLLQALAMIEQFRGLSSSFV